MLVRRESEEVIVCHNFLWPASSMQSIAQRWMCLDRCACCHTEIEVAAQTTETEVADQTCNLAQSEYADSWAACPSGDPITPGNVTT